MRMRALTNLLNRYYDSIEFFFISLWISLPFMFLLAWYVGDFRVIIMSLPFWISGYSGAEIARSMFWGNNDGKR